MLHAEDGLSPGARGESNPAVHVVVAVLGYVEHLVFCLIPSPFGGGKTSDCESVARQGRNKSMTGLETGGKGGRESYIGDGNMWSSLQC